MTKCSLFLVPLLVAIAVSDALQARAAGTLPRSATSVEDKATESTVSGKRALQSKEDTKGAADEEREPQPGLELLSTMTKSITDQMAWTWKGASFSVARVSPIDLEEAKAVVMELEKTRSDSWEAYQLQLAMKGVDKVTRKTIQKLSILVMENPGVQVMKAQLRKVQKGSNDALLTCLIKIKVKTDALARSIVKAKRKVKIIKAMIEVRRKVKKRLAIERKGEKVAPRGLLRPSEVGANKYLQPGH